MFVSIILLFISDHIPNGQVTHRIRNGHGGLYNGLKSITMDRTRRWAIAIIACLLAIIASDGLNVPDCYRSSWDMAGLYRDGLQGRI